MKTSDLEVLRERFVSITSEEDFNKEASFAIQLISKSTQLQKCSKNSLIGAVMNVANVGLTLNPVMKLAYIVPRYINRQMQACLEPSYQGLIKLITDTGSVTSVSANIVREGDDFSYELGINQSIIHKPKLGNKGDIIGVYAVATLHNGTKMVEVMSADEIESIRGTSESYKAFSLGKIKTCVWETYPSEMFRKTVLRRIVKYLPKTDRWDKIQEAIHLDEGDYSLSDNQLGYVEGLLHTAYISEEKRQQIEAEMFSYSSEEAALCIAYLQDNQPSIEEKVREGTASQKEIANYISEEDETIPS